MKFKNLTNGRFFLVKNTRTGLYWQPSPAWHEKSDKWVDLDNAKVYSMKNHAKCAISTHSLTATVVDFRVDVNFEGLK